MGWTWKEEQLDLILVPLGLWIMCSYHLFLLYRYLEHPHLTSIGFENNNKNGWVRKMLLIDPKDRGFALGVLNGQLSASTSLSSICLILCSLIGAVLGNSSDSFLSDRFILGDSSKSTSAIKYMMVLSCFLLAFACFVQTTRHFVHAGFLISMPTGDVPVECIQKSVIRGSNFWTVGLRALYFATTLLLWIFGPIPMFAGAVATVMILHFQESRDNISTFGELLVQILTVVLGPIFLDNPYPFVISTFSRSCDCRNSSEEEEGGEGWKRVREAEGGGRRRQEVMGWRKWGCD